MCSKSGSVGAKRCIFSMVSSLESAFLIGGLAATGEWLAGYLFFSGPLPPGALFPMAVLYGLVCAGAAGLFSTLLLPLPRLRRSPEKRWALTFSFSVSLWVFLMPAGTVNLRLLSHPLSPSCLAADAACLAVALVVGYGIFRSLSRSGRSCGWMASPAKGALPLGSFFLLAFLFSRIPPSCSSRPEAAGTPPETDCKGVLLIVADTLRADHLPSYGYNRRTAPHLTRFAEDGVLFLNASAQASLTKPSIATLMTSLYPSEHRANLVFDALPSQIRTLPEILQRHGFRTAVFSDNANVSPLFGFDRGVDHFFHPEGSFFRRTVLGLTLRRLSRRRLFPWRLLRALTRIEFLCRGQTGFTTHVGAPVLTRTFLSWLEENRDGPFFAYLHYFEPHSPYRDCPARFRTLFDPHYVGRRIDNFPYFSGLWPFQHGKPLPARERENLVAGYDGNIAYLDQSLGVLFQSLKEGGLYDDLCIIFTSDHGEDFYDHGGWGHGHSLFRELVHIPLIVKLPGSRGGGARREEPVALVDVFPTVLKALGLSTNPAVHGIPLFDTGDPDRAIFGEILASGAEAQFLQRGPYKLIRARQEGRTVRALYDLKTDPDEKEDLSEIGPEKREEMLRDLEALRKRHPRRGVPEKVPLDEGTRERLKSLGYLQ